MTYKEKLEKLVAEIERRIALYSGLSEETVNPNRIDEDRQILFFIDSMQEEPKECMYTKGDYTDEDRKILCEDCKEKCKFNKKEEPELVDEYFNEMLDPNIQYASREAGIKAHAEDYSFNIESELFQQLTPEQQKLWRKEIEQAVLSGGSYGLDLAKDKRYDEEPVSEDLEEVSKKYSFCVYFEEVLSDDDKEVLKERLVNNFKAGAQWQKQKDEKNIGELQWNAHEEGWDECKQEMMANAVEGVVYRFDGCGVASVHYNDPNGVPMAYFIPSEGLSAGDKVKIITIKEE